MSRNFDSSSDDFFKRTSPPPPPPPPRNGVTRRPVGAAAAAPPPPPRPSYYGNANTSSSSSSSLNRTTNASSNMPTASTSTPSLYQPSHTIRGRPTASVAAAPRSGGAPRSVGPRPIAQSRPMPVAQPSPFSTASATTGNSDWFENTSTSTTTAPFPVPSSAPTMMQQPHPIEHQQQHQQQQPYFPGAQPFGTNNMSSNQNTPSLMQSDHGNNNNPNLRSSSFGLTNRSSSQDSAGDDYENEPPLLEELGIHLPHILVKSRAVLVPTAKFTQEAEQYMDDTDMAGPLTFALLLGAELLLSGKIHFGYIYGFGMFGCLSMSLIINLMVPSQAGVSVWTVISVLGYSLLPVNALAGINAVLKLRRLGLLGVILASCTILWCTVSSTRLFEKGCGLRDQRYLVAYPIALLYSAFVMITIF
jgi:hypothetical protein